MTRRPLPHDALRCQAQVTKGDLDNRCMRRAVVGNLCRQHADIKHLQARKESLARNNAASQEIAEQMRDPAKLFDREAS